MTEEYLLEIARKGARLYAAEHPRPTQVNAIQAAEMLSISAQTVRKMMRDGRLGVNRCGLIPIIEIDHALAVRTKA